MARLAFYATRVRLLSFAREFGVDRERMTTLSIGVTCELLISKDVSS